MRRCDEVIPRPSSEQHQEFFVNNQQHKIDKSDNDYFLYHKLDLQSTVHLRKDSAQYPLQ